MGDSLKYWADQEAAAYESLYGDRDREADERLKELRNMKVSVFTVTDLKFIIDPFNNIGNNYVSHGWNDWNVKQLNEIYERVMFSESDKMVDQLLERTNSE